MSSAANPKDAVGTKKAPLSAIPACVMAEVGLGMHEGALKYGRFNWRSAAVVASVYYDATMRHLTSWYEGEDIDPDSGLSHITKAICSLLVLRDAMMQRKFNDDRPPRSKVPISIFNDHAAELAAKYPDPVSPHREIDATWVAAE